MSDAATAAKPAKEPVKTPLAASIPSTPPTNISTRREQTLRAAQMKRFAPSALCALGYGEYERMTAGAPADWTLADCLNPLAWANVAALVAEDAMKTRKNRVGSVIELHHPKFYADLIIRAVQLDQLNNPNGLIVACLGPAQDQHGRACARDLVTGLAWVDPPREE